MKKRIFTLLLIAVTYFSSCRKDAVTPAITQTTTGPKSTNSVPALNGDTTSYNVKGYLRIQLTNGPTNSDAILVDFNPSAQAAYIKGEDAPTLAGFGTVSLSSLSSDAVALSINALPLTQKGQTIGLAVNAKSTGTYNLNLTAVNSIPAVFDIWLKDGFKKDSLDFRTNPTYAFNINTADANTYGDHRFTLVVREK